MPSLHQLEEFYRPQYYGGDWYKQQGLGMAFARSALRNRRPGKFLDVGCGLGFYIDGIRKNSKWEVYGVEFASNVVDYARKELGLDVRHGDLTHVKFPSRYFDVIQIRNVLEHVTNPMELLRECRRIIKDDGVFHLAVPNGPVDSLDLLTFFASEKKPAVSNAGHVLFFSRESLFQLFEKSGFRIEKGRTYGIRRGLARLGYFPRKRNWKSDYVDRSAEAAIGGGKIALPPKKNRPDIYYRYRFWRMHSKMLPGLQKPGLDFELVLKPL